MHVLGTPPAFVLSQDQTLKKLYLNNLSAAQIKFLNNLLLAILLKNFRWLKFDFNRNLNNSSIVQGVHSSFSRYSIYKVQCSVPLSRSACLYYHIKFHLSRTFFKFFQFFLRDFSACCSREQLCYVSTSVSICQALFSSSCKFLSDLLFIWAVSRQLRYITTTVAICQALFHKFLHVFSDNLNNK